MIGLNVRRRRAHSWGGSGRVRHPARRPAYQTRTVRDIRMSLRLDAHRTTRRTARLRTLIRETGRRRRVSRRPLHPSSDPDFLQREPQHRPRVARDRAATPTQGRHARYRAHSAVGSTACRRPRLSSDYRSGHQVHRCGRWRVGMRAIRTPGHRRSCRRSRTHCRLRRSSAACLAWVPSTRSW